MPLNHQHQLDVLKDILSEHLSETNGTISEYEQMERLIQSLINNDQITDEMKVQLQEVYQYSQQGKQLADSQQHISDNEDSLTQWVDQLNQVSL